MNQFLKINSSFLILLLSTQFVVFLENTDYTPRKDGLFFLNVALPTFELNHVGTRQHLRQNSTENRVSPLENNLDRTEVRQEL